MEVTSGSLRGSAQRKLPWKLPRNVIFFHWLPRTSIDYNLLPQPSGCVCKLPLLPWTLPLIPLISWKLPWTPLPRKVMGASMGASTAASTAAFIESFHYFHWSFQELALLPWKLPPAAQLTFLCDESFHFLWD